METTIQQDNQEKKVDDTTPLGSLGFDEFNRKPIMKSPPAQSSIETDRFIESISGSSVVGPISTATIAPPISGNNIMASVTSANGKTRLDLDNVYAYFRDASNERVKIGDLGSGQYGIKVSAPGYDAGSAADANLIMSTYFDNLRVVSSGTKTITVANTDPQQTVTGTTAHGLSYIPSIIAFVGKSSVSYPTPYTILDSSMLNLLMASVKVDATNITFTVSAISANAESLNGNYVFKYYLLNESAN